jgi:hypothetical protein
MLNHQELFIGCHGSVTNSAQEDLTVGREDIGTESFDKLLEFGFGQSPLCHGYTMKGLKRGKFADTSRRSTRVSETL